jgi:hypothetical protein
LGTRKEQRKQREKLFVISLTWDWHHGEVELELPEEEVLLQRSELPVLLLEPVEGEYDELSMY